MEYSNPKKIDFKFSKISFGAWQLGNRFDFDEMKEESAIKLVQSAFQEGITLFDTAPNYGKGQSEVILGKALKGIRNKVFINTKFGHDSHGQTNFDVERLEFSVKESLIRLQTDYIDSVILHNPGREMLYGDHPIYKELNRLKQLGLIKHYGVSVDWPEELEIVLKENNLDVIELMFNIIHQSPKIWFDEIEKQGILLMIKVPLDSGWLSGKYTKETIFKGVRSRWTQDNIKTRLEIVDRIKEIVGEDILHASLKYILNYDAVSCVIPGIRTEDHLISNLKTLEYDLSIDIQKELESLYESYIKYQNTPW
ncbi:aldo/keto reductase [Hujiaoplasma nucleasis]|uniref:Aldo/keto reductase n=1 Tax=Hujiaoplasma nucleasis TaxID=2725268 RepID=A0A7L6N6A3_9MOLU|nr:aldo/keto reductase [Hujiaoplasma nucleasis]QLY40778.1 aldo/keto reductase [Hujiaoplasma nucleasis]